MTNLVCICGHTAFRVYDNRVACDRCANEMRLAFDPDPVEPSMTTLNLEAMHRDAAPIWKLAEENVPPVKPGA